MPPNLPASPHGESFRIAAVDVGSNSLHMVVAQADPDGGLTTLWRIKEPVGLGRMSFPSRRLSRDAIDRAVTTLERFQQAAQQRQCEKIVCIATSAVREAVNGGDFIELAREKLKLNIRVVSARDEARLIYLAVRHAFPLGKDPALIVDIGGGSVEFIVGDGTRAHLLESRKLGASRMTARFVKSDPLSQVDRKALLSHYHTELGGLFEQIRALKPKLAIGTSGTLENIAAMCRGGDAPTGTGSIEREGFGKLLRGLIKADSSGRAMIAGLDDTRRDQIVAGALLVGEVFQRLSLKRIVMCPAALREGILLDYLARHVPDLQIRREVPDPRRRSVIDLARRCNWHRTHSEHVAMLTMQLFDETRPLHGLTASERELVDYAALLHDIGWHIAREDHHKHSMYLILHGDLRGFTRDEIAVIANIARYHRKSPPKRKHKLYADLGSRLRFVVDVGSSLLRIADGLDRSQGQVVTGLKCRLADDAVTCRVTARSDAELELWGARRKKDLFESALGRKLRFEEK
jgi:exopolyphosphatase / guanosine-5'-triphosphate,3'-diphosphate pyrophosphatase